MLMQTERELIAEYGKKMSAAGLCPGTSGNLSIYNRELGLVAISPSGIDYMDTLPEDVVICDTEGNIRDSDRKPSSELGLHLAFYKSKPSVNSIVHTHSGYCTTFAVLGEPLRAVHYVIGDAETDTVPCAPYRCFGTEELASAAVDACGGSMAVLLANHGLVACGADIKNAFSLANNLEYVAMLQYRAMCIGKPNILSTEQMVDVMNRFKSYGQGGENKTGY